MRDSKRARRTDLLSVCLLAVLSASTRPDVFPSHSTVAVAVRRFSLVVASLVIFFIVFVSCIYVV